MREPDGRELRAYQILEEILGATIRHTDDGSAQGQYDAEIHYADGRVAALEVTANEASKFLNAENMKRQENPLHPYPHISDLQMSEFIGWLNAELAVESVARNFAKLDSACHDEQHLLLYLYGEKGETFAALIGFGELPDEDPEIPYTCTHLWIVGSFYRVLRWTREEGWSLHPYTAPTIEQRREAEERGGAPGKPRRKPRQDD